MKVSNIQLPLKCSFVIFIYNAWHLLKIKLFSCLKDRIILFTPFIMINNVEDCDIYWIFIVNWGVNENLFLKWTLGFENGTLTWQKCNCFSVYCLWIPYVFKWELLPFFTLKFDDIRDFISHHHQDANITFHKPSTRQDTIGGMDAVYLSTCAWFLFNIFTRIFVEKRHFWIISLSALCPSVSPFIYPSICHSGPCPGHLSVCRLKLWDTFDFYFVYDAWTLCFDTNQKLYTMYHKGQGHFVT